jgi:HSP20 family molecular chaperone IbpA
MDNAGGDKNRTAGTSSSAWTMWDPLWLMRQMFGWGRSADAPAVDVKETDDTYVCKVNVKLALPDQVDAAHVKAQLEDGKLTLVVPKAAAAVPERERQPDQQRQASSPSPKARRTTGNDRRRSAGHARRRKARTPARRG